jgi:peptide/nickel transport system substrate-binding protein
MATRLWLSVGMAAVGLSLLVASAFTAAVAPAARAPAGTTAEVRGGTLRLDGFSDFDYVDPALAYFLHTWAMLNATNVKLLSFPDKDGAAGTRMRPEAADGLPRISKDGRTYVFAIKRGFRFSDGSPVTARSFARAFQRALSPDIASPAASFLDDVRSYAATSEYSFVVRLKRVAPDFLARVTMPFFSAVPVDLPVKPEGIGAPSVSAGPYYLQEWTPGRSALVVRNPYWNNSKEPWKSLGRPANVDRIVYTIGVPPATQRLRVEANETDIGGFPLSQTKELVDKYGINQGRFFVRRAPSVWYIVMNTQSQLFRNNLKLRQAVNFAIDRPQLVRQVGFLAGSRTDQILPPGIPGFHDYDIYPLKGANPERARALARGNLRSGKAVYYSFNVSSGPPIAQSVQFQLKQIGLDVEIKLFDRIVQHAKMATRGEPFDLGIEGWGADYPDPYDFINVLLDGRRLQAENNANVSYWDDPAFNTKMEAASRLSGSERLTAYGKLDADIMRNGAPLAAFLNDNALAFVSEDLGCFSFSSINGTVNLAAVCKKQ